MKWTPPHRLTSSALRTWLGSCCIASALLCVLPAHAAAPGPDGNRGHLNRLVHNEKVIAHLQLTAEQASAAQKASNEAVEHHRTEFATAMQAPERAERVPKVAETFRLTDARAHTHLKTILSPLQLERFRQIEVQTLGLRAFQRADVVQALDLKAAQQEALRPLIERTGEQLSGIQRSKDLSADEKAQQARQVRQQAVAQVRQQLSGAQWLQWELLSGAEFVQ